MSRRAALLKSVTSLRRELAAVQSARVSTTFDELARMLDEAVAAAKQRVSVEPGDRRTLAESDPEFAAELGRISNLAV